MPGQHDDQRPADGEPESPPPAAGLTAPPGQVKPPGQPRVAQVGVHVLAEPGEVPPGLEQPGLDPAEGRAARRRRRGLGAGTPTTVPADRAMRAAELHPVEEQLVPVQAIAVFQDRDRASGQASGEPGLVAGLLPAQPAVAVLDRQDPPAPGAPGLAGMLVPPDRARAAAAPV